MRTHSIHGPRRVWRSALGGAAALLTIGTFGVLGSAPAQAQAMGDEGPLIPVFVVQPVTTQVNVAVTPAVVVKVENFLGQVDSDYNGPVLLKYAINRDGAPEPTGNEVNAYHGVATFPKLTFSAVGFGFELFAVIPSETDQAWLPGWNWIPGFGGISAPSSPFDIVDQILNCQSTGDGQSAGDGQSRSAQEGQGTEGICRTETVSSGGTSGFSVADTSKGSGQLTATGGGFPPLSCGPLGGIVSFFSNLPQTITATHEASLADHHELKSFNICFGSTQPFITKFGFPALFNPVNDDFEGLLPNCSPYRPAPCVLSRSKSWPWSGAVTITVLAPAGDPHITIP